MTGAQTYVWCVASTYVLSAGRLIDPGETFICATAEAADLSARGKAVRDAHTPGVRVTTRCVHAALVDGLVVNGRSLRRGEDFACTDDEGACLAAAGHAVRLPWKALPALYEPTPPAVLPQRGRSVFRRNP